MNKTQLGVIFGSRSCEREVAIISAADAGIAAAFSDVPLA